MRKLRRSNGTTSEEYQESEYPGCADFIFLYPSLALPEVASLDVAISSIVSPVFFFLFSVVEHGQTVGAIER